MTSIKEMLSKNLRKVQSVFFMWLFLSTSFISSFNIAFTSSAIADPDDATCESVIEREMNWPIVKYCAEPAVVGSDNQFYVYVDKHTNDPEFSEIELVTKGIEVIQVEPLTPNTVSFVGGKIIVRGTGEFIVHGKPASCSGISDKSSCTEANCEWSYEYCGDIGCLYNGMGDCLDAGCDWDYYEDNCYDIYNECNEIDSQGMCTIMSECKWQDASCSEPDYQMELSPTNKKVQVFSTEECTDLVTFMLYVQESGRENYVDLKSPLEAFGAFILAGFSALKSQIVDAEKENYGTSETITEQIRFIGGLRQEFDEKVSEFVLRQSDYEDAALVAIKKGVKVDLFDLEGLQLSRESYMFTDKSVEIATDVWSRANSGEYDMVLFLHRHTSYDNYEPPFLFPSYGDSIAPFQEDGKLIVREAPWLIAGSYIDELTNERVLVYKLFNPVGQTVDQLGSRIINSWDPIIIDENLNIVPMPESEISFLGEAHYLVRDYEIYQYILDDTLEINKRINDAIDRGDKTELSMLRFEMQGLKKKIPTSLGHTEWSELQIKIYDDITTLGGSIGTYEGVNLGVKKDKFLEVFPEYKTINLEDNLPPIMKIIPQIVEVQGEPTVTEVIAFESQHYRDYLYRGIRPEGSRSFMDLISDVIENKQIGTEWEVGYRVSSSFNPEVANRFSGSGKDSIIFMIDNSAMNAVPYKYRPEGPSISEDEIDFRGVPGQVYDYVEYVLVSEENRNAVLEKFGEDYIGFGNKPLKDSIRPLKVSSVEYDDYVKEFINFGEVMKEIVEINAGIIDETSDGKRSIKSFTILNPDKYMEINNVLDSNDKLIIESTIYMLEPEEYNKIPEFWDEKILERQTESEITRRFANQETALLILDEYLEFGETVGENIQVLIDEGYDISPELIELLDRAGLEWHIKTNAVESVGNEATKISTRTIDMADESVMNGKASGIMENSKELAKFKYSDLVTGAGLTALFTVGPRLRELGHKKNDATLLMAADVIQAGGFSAMAAMFLGVVAREGTKKGVLYTTALLADQINILSLGKSGLVPDPVGMVIYLIAHVTVTYTWCKVVDPSSTACGCSPNPYYGKTQLELEKNIVTPNEEINFVVYGMQYCGPSGPEDKKLYTSSLLKDKAESSPISFLSICLFEEDHNGRCCEGTYSVDLGMGEYDLYGEVQTVSFGGGWKPKTDTQKLLVVDESYIPKDFTIELKEGWNLISTPYRYCSFDTSDCKIYSNLLHYSTGKYESLNISEMEGGVGYWMYVYYDCDAFLDDCFEPITPPTDFSAGWNHIAIPPEGLHRGYVGCDQIEDPKTWDTETGEWVYVENMNPGKSYFVDCYPER